MVRILCHALFQLTVFYVNLKPKYKNFLYAFGAGYLTHSYGSEIKSGLSVCVSGVLAYIG